MVITNSSLNVLDQDTPENELLLTLIKKPSYGQWLTFSLHFSSYAHSIPQSVAHSWPAFRKHPLFATLPLRLAPVWLIDVLVIVPLPLTRESVERP